MHLRSQCRHSADFTPYEAPVQPARRTYSYPEPDKTSSRKSDSISLTSNLILFYHLRPCLASDLYYSGFPINILYAFILLP